MNEHIKQAIEIVHNLRKGLTYGLVYESSYDALSCPCASADFFGHDILNLLHDPNQDGAEALAELILAHHKPNQHPDKVLGFRGWNAPKHPIRNFLIVFRIDYPIKKNVDNSSKNH
jgi:hypothetical protein